MKQDEKIASAGSKPEIVSIVQPSIDKNILVYVRY